LPDVSTVATPGNELDHTPPVTLALKVVEVPEQRLEVPKMVGTAGSGLMVIRTLVLPVQPLAEVTV